jgi:hypothetical protein
MPSADPPPHLVAMFQAIVQQQGGLSALYGGPKWVVGHQMLRSNPEKWFRDTQIDDRDLALINADPSPWIDIGQDSYLKHVVRDNPFLARQ